MSVNPYSPPNSIVNDDRQPSTTEVPEEISFSELEAFTGKCSYPRKIKAFYDGQTKHAGFNYWAAIFGTHWFVFRKLYLSALAALFIEVGAPLILGFLGGFFHLINKSSTGMVVIVSFLTARIVIGFFGNMALAWKAKEVILKVDGLNLDNSEHLKQISQQGGVSVIALLVYCAIFGFVGLITGRA